MSQALEFKEEEENKALYAHRDPREDIFGHDIVDNHPIWKGYVYPEPPIMEIALVREGAIFQKANNDPANAGYDMKAFDMTIEDGYIKFMLGIKSAAPIGYYWEVVHKSGNSKFDSILANTKGTIDCDFRGEWQARVKLIPQPNIIGDITNNGFLIETKAQDYIQLWKEGEIALQAILHKEPEHQIKFVDQSQLSETQRGEGGFGSTGNGLIKGGLSKPLYDE